MKTITRIEVQKRNPKRVSIYLNGKYAFGLSRIVSAWLKVGQKFSEAEISELRTEDDREIVYQKALNYLNYRIRTESELRRYLRKHSVTEENINILIERLKENNLIDDEEFARQWVDNRIEFRPRSSKAIAFELRQKGIDYDVIQNVLQDVNDDQMAYLAGQRKAKQIGGLNKNDFQQKLYSYLSR